MDNQSIPLILASSSPYRTALLEKLQLAFQYADPKIDESQRFNESPEHLAMRLAAAKAQALVEQFPDSLIIGADQVALLGGRKLQKPGDFESARTQLHAASGHCMTFYTGICLLNAKSSRKINEVEICKVYFRRLSDSEIEDYLRREQPYDCVGAFKAEGLGIALFERIESSDPTALIGLPLIKLTTMLRKFGIRVLGS
ncbi:MAG: septum formation inhibitor Maf [Methylothermaceae bacteria B42]|nr:MAG: septum formation inhibitor Maf [Methylothermaceae bacteria B42]HHJ39187.1 septum formation inhibitor Maf [Methylothermaceae bacterium]